MSIQLTRTWEPAEVESELRAALDIVERLDPPSDLRQLTFQTSAQLLTQRAMRPAGGLVLGTPPLQ